MDDASSLVVLAALILGYAAVSRRLTGSPVTAPMVFVAGGVVLSEEALGWLGPGIETTSVRLLAESTLALVLFADASRIDLTALRREYVVPVRLLALGLPLTIVAGALAGVAVFGELLLVEAVILAIVLAPTDAALGQAVVVDPRIPSRVRQGLNVESGLNDGICVPLLLLAIAIAAAEEGTIGGGAAARLVAEEIGYGALGGCAAGLSAALVVKYAFPRGLVESHWLQVVPFAGAALAYALSDWFGGSGFIGAFVGGVVFGGVRRGVGGDTTEFIEEAGGVLSAVTFVVFGAAMLAPALGDVTASAVLYAVLSLTVVRMAPVAFAMLGTGARSQTVAFLGWFGPRGLASIVFTVLLLEEAELVHQEQLTLTIVTTVALSVLLHGLTAAPLAGRYARWYAAARRERPHVLEAGPAPEQRWRLGASSDQG